ncbi:MAG: RluA family pseudouridine synthase, partial [Corallococcus sp.]|nr:RluA family pseudouridine synthase [Corallococcus sp.]
CRANRHKLRLAKKTRVIYNYPMKKFVVDKALANKTLKDYFAAEGYSTSQVKRFKYGGTMSVNGQLVTVRHLLREGDVVELEAIDRLLSPVPSKTEANILYADEYLYVAEKPYGVAVHPDRAHFSDTLGNMLAARFGETFKLRIITRLDKTTSGLVLGTLDEITARKLNDMQKRHDVVKHYCALVSGRIPNDEGTIDEPLTRLDGENKTVTSADGKPSVTEYKVIERRENSTLVNIRPVTGRTHQIRAHMAFIGHPIIGDELYGGAPAERVMLHCERLTFTHPYSNERIDAYLPVKF